MPRAIASRSAPGTHGEPAGRMVSRKIAISEMAGVVPQRYCTVAFRSETRVTHATTARTRNRSPHGKIIASQLFP